MTFRKCLYFVAGLVIFLSGSYLRYESAISTRVIQPVRANAREYVIHAYNLRINGVYSQHLAGDPYRPVVTQGLQTPGYPLFLAIFMDRWPDDAMIAEIVLCQTIISGITMILAFLLFRMFLPVHLSLAAMALTALSPHLINFNSYLLTETLNCFLLVLFVWIMGLFWKKQSPWLLAAAGSLMGLCMLVHPGLEGFVPVMLVFLACRYGIKKGGKSGAVLLLGLFLVMFPWIIRNLITLGAITDNTHLINFVFNGMYPDFVFEGAPASFPYPYLYDPRAAEISKSIGSALSEIARRFHDEPIRHIIWFLVGKPLVLWSWDVVEGIRDAFVYPVSTSPYFSSLLFRSTHLLMHVLHGPLVLLAFAASLTAFFPLSRSTLPPESIATVRLIALLLLYFTVLHMIGAPDPRYTIPLRPVFHGMALFFPYIQFRLTMPTQRMIFKSPAKNAALTASSTDSQLSRKQAMFDS
ncbi:MAG TPA: glycosyltransferase family 39 protein [Syntrophobacteraceae bacterium]|nr:glycosyltransferase family 39 protein [Syntrophobacteraceae bacterium]